MSPGKIIGLILIIVGVYVCYLGNTRRNSVAGGVDNAVAKVADKVTGEGHTTDATWYFVGGGVLILVGAGAMVRKS